ncbi:hypothetical protein GCM10022630_24430 [Thermobifida alba]
MVSGARLGTSLGTSLFNALAPCGVGASSPVREAPTTPPTPADTAATTATTSSTAHRGRPPLRCRGADAWEPWGVAAAGHGPVGGPYGGCHGPGPPAETGVGPQVWTGGWGPAAPVSGAGPQGAADWSGSADRDGS